MFPEQPSPQGAGDVQGRNSIVQNMPGMQSIMPLLELLMQIIPQQRATSKPYKSYEQEGRPNPALKQRMMGNPPPGMQQRRDFGGNPVAGYDPTGTMY